MRKLAPIESSALLALSRRGAYCPGTDRPIWASEKQLLVDTLDVLVKKKRVAVEMTDDGPRYTLTAQGEADAA